MAPLVDPRLGDVEDDASSTKRRSLLAIAGSLLAEISLPKLVVAWVLLIALPGILLGLAPLIVSGWLATLSRKITAPLGGIWPLLLLMLVVALGWWVGGLCSGRQSGLLVAELAGRATGLRALPRGLATPGGASPDAAAWRWWQRTLARGHSRGCGDYTVRDSSGGRDARLAGLALDW